MLSTDSPVEGPGRNFDSGTDTASCPFDCNAASTGAGLRPSPT
ncbi:hypothetical protein OG943_34705 [Amycolatopsis sp. NBC_00345]